MTKIITRPLVITLLLLLSACQTVPEVVVETTPELEPDHKKVIILSSEGINNPSTEELLFAQTALKKLGYSLGAVDGIWGQRSAASMISFEKNNKLESANGQLSILNLDALKKRVGPLDIQAIKTPVVNQAKTIGSKLSSTTIDRNAPELIIIDKTYSLMSKANPYSHIVSQIEAGTGIYVLSLQNGWYEVETLSKKYGFIKEN